MVKSEPGPAIVVEGRDDIRAVSEACDALVIATHGYGISAETWRILEKAYNEKGLIILTDPDHAGREIRRRLKEKFPDAIDAYLDREDAVSGEDIGVENAKPEAIAEAIRLAIENAGLNRASHDADEKIVDMHDLTELGLAASPGSAERRAAVCKALGIGYGNAAAMIKKLKGFGIGLDELTEASRKIK